MRRKFFVYLPVSRAGAEGEWEQCLQQIVVTQSSGLRPLKLNIYVDSPGFDSYRDIRQKIAVSVRKTFGDFTPAFNVTVHPPEEPWKIAVEAQFLDPGEAGSVTKYYNSIPYVVVGDESEKEVWGAGLCDPEYTDDIQGAASAAFEMMVQILSEEGLSLNNIVRQWNYIGNILSLQNERQNYQIFNEVRSEFYGRYRTVKGYPAATGVGMKLGGVALDFCAVAPGMAGSVKPVDNPNQINAYEYGQQVLLGVPGIDKIRKNPPQFERALLLPGKKYATLFVSGTASIIGQETIGKEDIEKQTHVTIGNIMKLTGHERISTIWDKHETCTGSFSLLRIYIKRREDFNTVRSICREHFPGIPAVYIMADICREELLTEIEAELLYKV